MPDFHLHNEIQPLIAKINISLLNANIFRTFHLVENFLTLSFPWFISRQISLPNYLSLLFNIFSIWRTEHVRRSEIPSFASRPPGTKTRSPWCGQTMDDPLQQAEFFRRRIHDEFTLRCTKMGSHEFSGRRRLNDHYFLNDCLGKDGRKRIRELFPIKF